MQYWLVKTEPEEYSFDDLIRDKEAMWDGIRNYQARNYLKQMKKDDQVLVYHTGESKEIVGVAKVVSEYYADPSDKTGTWVVIKLAPVKQFRSPFNLTRIKKEKSLSNLPLLKQQRLSVMPLGKLEFDFIVKGSESE